MHSQKSIRIEVVRHNIEVSAVIGSVADFVCESLYNPKLSHLPARSVTT